MRVESLNSNSPYKFARQSTPASSNPFAPPRNSENRRHRILDVVRALPADKQREFLDHVKRFPDEAMQPREPRKSGRGLWADLNIDLGAEVIDEARRKIWKDFRQG